MQFSIISIIHENILKLFLAHKQGISDNVLFFFDIQTSVLMQNLVNNGQIE